MLLRITIMAFTLLPGQENADRYLKNIEFNTVRERDFCPRAIVEAHNLQRTNFRLCRIFG